MASGPRRLNVVSLLLLVGAVAAGYWGWKFFPVYYTGWQVDHLLSDAAAQTYQVVRLPEPARSRGKLDIETSTRAKVVALGVTDPAMALRIDVAGDTATAFCDYTAIVDHSWVNKHTVIAMRRKASADVKRVQW